MGRDFGDLSVQSDMKHWPFKVNKSGKPTIQVKYKCEEKSLVPKKFLP